MSFSESEVRRLVMSRAYFHLAGTDGGADAGKEVIDAHRTQIGAFPCHVGAGDDDEKRSFHHVDVIAYSGHGSSADN